MKTISIYRDDQNEFRTLGTGVVLSDDFEELFRFVTVELPWKENQKFISCIPAGEYDIKIVKSPKFGPAISVMKVPNRTHILFHPANLARELQGCIAPGLARTLNGVKDSRDAMDILLKLDPRKLIIK